MECIERCKLFEVNDIIITNHRSHIIDINLERYYDAQLSTWDQINWWIINPVWRSHREQFCKIVEKQIDIFQLDRDINRTQVQPSRDNLERIDSTITHIFKIVWKTIKGPCRNIPYSKEKEIRRSKLLFWKARIK